MKSNKRFHSLLYKNTMITLLVGALLILLISVTAPRIFYLSAKKELSTYITNTIKECSVRLSYLLSNHRNTLDLRRDEEFLSLLQAYREDPDGSSDLLSQIQSYLSVRIIGHQDDGSIYSENYSIVAVGYEDYFYAQEDAALAQALKESGVLQNIQMDENGTFYSEAYYLDQDRKCYIPVLTFDLDGEEVPYLCFVGAFRMEDTPCFAVSLMPYENLSSQLHSLNDIGISDYSLISDNHILCQSQETEETLADISAFPAVELQYDVSTLETRDGFSFLSLCTYQSERLYLNVNVSRSEMIAPYAQFFFIQRILLVLLVILMVISFYLIFRPSLNRLKKMDREMSKVRSGDFDLVLNDTRQDEIGSIAGTINTMVDTIKTSLEHEIASEKVEKEMQYSLMVSAIDPHFIYNTLDTVTFLAAMGKCQDIITVNNALIGTLKDRLKVTQLMIYDTVDNERKVLEQYMIITGYLYAAEIDYQFLAPEACLSLKIPKNILQPLVENAIKHGLMPNKNTSRTKVRRGQILVRVEKQEDFILLSVADNGVGMTEEQRSFYLGELPTAGGDPEHIGILNLRQRLCYLYQENYEFDIESPKEGGTIITIRLKL